MLRVFYVLRWSLLPVGVSLAVWLLVDLVESVDLDKTGLPWNWVTVSTLIGIGYIALNGLLWHQVTLLHSVNIPIRFATSIYMTSNIGKYIPLKIMGISYRISFYSHRFGKGTLSVVMACYTETLAALLGGVLLATLLFPVTSTLWNLTDWWANLMIAVALSVLLLPKTQHMLISLALRLTKKHCSLPKESALSNPWLVVQYGAVWLVLGTSLFALCIGFGLSATLENYVFVTQIYIVAGVTGMLAFILPSGIGVREGVMMLGLTNLLPTSEAAVVTVLARICITSAEIIGAFFSFIFLEYAMGEIKKKRHK